MHQRPKIPDYSMFSSQGNAVVHGIVLLAKHSGMSPEAVMEFLWKEAGQHPGLEEISDTAVREAIWSRLNT